MTTANLALRTDRGCELWASTYPALSIVVPAFNEARRLGPTLVATLEYLDRRCLHGEILVVDDGSTDGTADIVRACGDARVTLIRLEQNRGKGFAVREGVRAAQGELVLFMDADLATPLDQLEQLERAISDGYDVAVGSRALPASPITAGQSVLRKVMSRTFNAFVRFVAVGGICDTQCGFKLFTRRAAKALFGAAHIDRYAFDVEILLLARDRFTVAEVPVAWRHVEESKISPVRDSLRMVFDILAMRLRLATKPALGFQRKPSLLPTPAE